MRNRIWSTVWSSQRTFQILSAPFKIGSISIIKQVRLNLNIAWLISCLFQLFFAFQNTPSCRWCWWWSSCFRWASEPCCCHQLDCYLGLEFRILRQKSQWDIHGPQGPQLVFAKDILLHSLSCCCHFQRLLLVHGTSDRKNSKAAVQLISNYLQIPNSRIDTIHRVTW